MRVFVAIPVSEDLQREVLTWSVAYTNLPVRWLKGKNLHVTLVPPWEEELENIPEVLGLIKKAADTMREPLTLSFSRVRFGPDPRRPRLIWAEGAVPPELAVLSRELHRALGLPEERRPLRLHLTVARFRPEDFRTFPIQRLDERVSWRWEARLVTLMQSHLLRGGAEYEVLGEVPFSSRGGR